MAARRGIPLPLNAALSLLIVLYMPNWSRTRQARLWSIEGPYLYDLTVLPNGLGSYISRICRASIGINRPDDVEFTISEAAFFAIEA